MKAWFTPFQVGLVMIAGIAAFMYMFGTISMDVLGGDDGYVVEATIHDATGLVVDGRVMIAGIPVGTVEDVSLVDGQALVRMRLRDDLVLFEGTPEEQPDGTMLWRNGATLTKKQASLLGDYYLELTPGLGGAQLANGDEIRNVVRPIGPDTLFAQMDEIARNLEAISLDVRQVTHNMADVFGDEEGRRQLENIMNELESTVSAVSAISNENRAQIAQIVDNTEMITQDVRDVVRGVGRDTEVLMADLRGLTGELRAVVANNSDEVSAGIVSARRSLERLESTVASMEYSLRNVEVITDRIADGEGTIGRLVNDPAIAEETQRLLENANNIVGGVSRIQTWVELRSEYGMVGQSFKNYLSLSLRPSPDKMYIFELVDDPRGSTSFERETSVTNDPDVPPGVYRETVRTTDDFRVTFLLGRRWATGQNRNLLIGGRWGIIESSGGLGIDFWMLRESLQIRADVFDFLAEENVRLRAFAMLQLDVFSREVPWLSNLFVQGGIDDAFNPGTRQFFAGLGIRFNDLDLKGLLIAAPTPSF
jgi:phospholipid/cholesterol/gamma-HCH transport system substrate-binding protein